MNDSVASNSVRPSAIGAFFRGFFSSALTGAMMMGIFLGLAALTTAFLPVTAGFYAHALSMLGGTAGAAGLFSGHTLIVSGFTSLATGLFGGALAAKRALFDAPSTNHDTNTTYIPIPIAGMSGPVIAPVISRDIAPEQDAPPAATRWTERAGRDTVSQSRIQTILNKSTMTDKDRAQAILADREAAVLNQNTSRA